MPRGKIPANHEMFRTPEISAPGGKPAEPTSAVGLREKEKKGWIWWLIALSSILIPIGYAIGVIIYNWE